MLKTFTACRQKWARRQVHTQSPDLSSRTSESVVFSQFCSTGFQPTQSCGCWWNLLVPGKLLCHVLGCSSNGPNNRCLTIFNLYEAMIRRHRFKYLRFGKNLWAHYTTANSCQKFTAFKKTHPSETSRFFIV